MSGFSQESPSTGKISLHRQSSAQIKQLRGALGIDSQKVATLPAYQSEVSATTCD
jgi:hypothetical protein